MNELNGKSVMMSSIEIQQVITELAKDKSTGVKAKEHKNIIADIRNMLKSLDGSVFSHDSYLIEKDNRGYDSLIHLNKDLTVRAHGYITPKGEAWLLKGLLSYVRDEATARAVVSFE